MLRYLLLLFGLCVQTLLAIQPTEVAVVYNADSVLSRAAAERYRKVRGIPTDQMLPLFGVARGEISRADFEACVVTPLLVQGRQRGLYWPSGPRNGRKLMRAMVLMPDIPLRVKEELRDGKPVGTGQKRTEAAVDSELALLGARFSPVGMGNNPLYKKEKMPSAREPQPIMSVCRIDGPDEETIYRMINVPAAVERTGLWGWVVVDNGGPYPDGDKMLAASAQLAKQHHQPLFYEDSRKTLADSFPLMSDVAVYFGWYTNPANGPFHSNAPSDFRFANGAIACHLHSYSATGLYDGKTWVSALLKRGACVTAGNVAEPYLGACLNYELFYRHLLAGKQVGEAALLASPTVSWQTIVLGDPLYRPFRKDVRPPLSNPFVIWQQACRRANGNLTYLQTFVEQQMYRPHGGLFAEIYALACAENKQFAQAVLYFDAAKARRGTSRDKMRLSLFSLTAQAAAGDKEGAETGVLALQNESAASPFLPAVRQTADALVPKKEPRPAEKTPQK